MASRAFHVTESALIERAAEMLPDIAKTITEASIRARLAHHSDARCTEGFLAKMIVLVEGDTEYVTLPLIARACEFDFDEHGIVVVPADGKTVMPLLMALFDSFHLPWFAIFDADADSKNAHEDINRALQNAAGIDDSETFPSTYVSDKIAAIRLNFDAQLREDIGTGQWDIISTRVNLELGLRSGSNKSMRAKAVVETFLDENENELPQFWIGLITAIRKNYESFYDSSSSENDDNEEEDDDEIPF